MIEKKPDGFIQNGQEFDMAHDPMNPFGLPHMGTSMNNPSQNPMMASMEMMRQAMTGLGQSAQTASGTMPSALTPEDLERKISELKVVENWLKLNLSMLGGSIQGLEVQLATVKTLRSFVAMGSTPSASTNGEPSPLEVVLGLKPAPQQQPEAPSEPQKKSAAAADFKAADSKTTDATANSSAAAQAWWKMIEGQFAQLAAATTQANSVAQAAAKTTPSKKTTAKTTAKPAARRTAAATVKRSTKTVARR